MSLVDIFCEVDDFCKFLENYDAKLLPKKAKRSVGRKRLMSLSEVMTITIYFHASRMRTFKDYYKNYVCKYLTNSFPQLVSYNRFVELMKEASMPLLLFTDYCCRKSKVTGVSFIDSTKITVCHPLRINSNRVFKNIAAVGKTSTGWFYGFKLHLTINELGEIISFYLTPGNIDDRNDKVINAITKRLYGKLFGDKGYLSSSLFKKLYNRNIKLFTRIKKNMKNKLLLWIDKQLLRKRAIIESVNEKLKSYCFIEHSRHRSLANFFTNTCSAIAAYQFSTNKPSIKSRKKRLGACS